MKNIFRLLILTLFILTVSCTPEEKIVEKEVEVIKRDTIYLDKIIEKDIIKEVIKEVEVIKTVEVIKEVEVIKYEQVVDYNLPQKAQDFLKTREGFLRWEANKIYESSSEDDKKKIVFTCYWMDDTVPRSDFKNKVIVVAYRQTKIHGTSYDMPFLYTLYDYDPITTNYSSHNVYEDSPNEGFYDSNNRFIHSLGEYGYLLGACSYRNLKK